jgi:hypothetical protein
MAATASQRWSAAHEPPGQHAPARNDPWPRLLPGGIAVLAGLLTLLCLGYVFVGWLFGGLLVVPGGPEPRGGA